MKIPNELGPTGDAPPGGKLFPDDTGGINVGITIIRDTVVMAFRVPVSWLGMKPREARLLARSLIERADEIEAE